MSEFGKAEIQMKEGMTKRAADSPVRVSRAQNPPSQRKRKDNVAEILLMKHMDELGFSYAREAFFHHSRRWRFDFANWTKRIAIEIEGGAWVQGRHTRGKGFEADIRKYNEAARLGWIVIRFTPNMIERGESKVFLQELFRTK